MNLSNKRFNDLNDEAKGNVVLIIGLVASIMCQEICVILSDTGVFVLNYPFKFVVVQVVLALPVLIMLISDKNLLEKSWLKYYLLIIMAIMIGILCTLLYYHTTLILVIPMVTMSCYRSRKVSVFCGIITALEVVLTPFLAYRLGGIDPLFPSWYTSIVDSSYLSEKGLNYITTIARTFSPTTGLLAFVAIPRLITLGCFFVLSFFGSYITRKSYEKKVNNILALQNNALDAMAEIIENRDLSTGGHVKRTRHVVNELVKYARPIFPNSLDYWENVVKSATMHDFGKIAISDSILQKPAKLTPEEFEKIKEHPDKSVEIIKKVLGNIEDEDLLIVAENLARYHHEKYDGSGYPAGLKGDNIPLEARIMAIADVWDALVSKRCYKEAYSYQEAHRIITESMGSHFDPKLLPVFEKAYPSIVKLYSDFDSE